MNTPGQYNSLNSALNASNVGDTIYLTPSPISYGDASITHAVTILGGGYNNPATHDNLTSIVGNLNLNNTSNNSVFSGLQIANVVFAFFGSQSNNITISLCNITGICSITGSGTIVQNCIIADLRIDWVAANSVYASAMIGQMSNIAVRNNFITGNVSGVALLSNNYFYHNIIEGHINTITNCTFNDNIFFYSDLANSAASSFLVFNNNGVYGPTATNDLAYMSAGTNIGSNNVSSTSPSIFNNNVSSAQTYSGLLNSDWQVANGALEQGTATDGTDMGIYGGNFPFPYYQGFPTNQNFTGTTQLPQMVYMNIPNPSVGLNQPLLNVEFKARQQK